MLLTSSMAYDIGIYPKFELHLHAPTSLQSFMKIFCKQFTIPNLKTVLNTFLSFDKSTI